MSGRTLIALFAIFEDPLAQITSEQLDNKYVFVSQLNDSGFAVDEADSPNPPRTRYMLQADRYERHALPGKADKI
jgi:hypothetical protein